MKQVCLFRHGKAAPQNVGLADFERSLTNFGIEETKKSARSLDKGGFAFDLFISSPSDRALETAHVAAKQLEFPIQQIRLNASLYAASSAVPVIEQIRALPEQVNSAILFGHNPSFDAAVAFLVENFADTIPKSGAVVISCGTTQWTSVSRHTGRLVAFLQQDSQRGLSLD